MALPAALLLDLAMNDRVQGLAVRAFDTVYSRIFKKGPANPGSTRIEAQPPAQTGTPVLDRLDAIEGRLATLPTDHEMANAFAAMQAEIRAGQQRTLMILAVLGLINGGLILALFLR
jgi:hypothetical protein